MKKIIFMGEQCDDTHDFYLFLKEQFDVKLCTLDFDVLQGVKKVFKPDLIILCFIKCTNPDKRFMDRLSESNRRIPVISIGLEMLDATFEKIHSSSSYQNLPKKTEKDALYDKINEMLGIAGKSGETSVERRNSGRPLILVVDDFALQLRQMRSMLKEKYDVEVATSGVQAMSAIGRYHPDLVLLDYAMPVYNGKKIFEVLKMSDETKDIPIIFLTGISEHAKVEEILDLKPDGYLLKPPDKDKLFQMIDKVLGRKQ